VSVRVCSQCSREYEAGVERCPRDGASTFVLEPTVVRSSREAATDALNVEPKRAARVSAQLDADVPQRIPRPPANLGDQRGAPGDAKGGSTAAVPDRTTVVDPLIGAQVGEYVINGLLGQGGMGIVYEAFQPVIGKRVAIKCLKRELAADPEEEARLLAEARAANSIGHRGIIDIFSFGTLADGRRYFAMEYLTGRPLSDRIDQGPMAVLETLRLMDEILAPLAAAHAAGVIHRDLKPNNIFLVAQPDGTTFVKLLDFGLAKLGRGTTPQTNVKRIHGTPEFMAPEQARGQAVSPRTDLYALGVIAYEMLTGRAPFEAEAFMEVVQMHLSEPVPRLSTRRRGVPPDLEALVTRLMAKSPDERPQSAAAVRAELAQMLRSFEAPGPVTEPSFPAVFLPLHAQPALEPSPLAPPLHGVQPDPKPTVPTADTRVLAASVGARPALPEAGGATAPRPRGKQRRHRRAPRYALWGLGAAAVALVLALSGLWLLPKLPAAAPPLGAPELREQPPRDRLPVEGRLRLQQLRRAWEEARAARPPGEALRWDAALERLEADARAPDADPQAVSQAADRFAREALGGRAP
jgi:serine/threonine protein kinase